MATALASEMVGVSGGRASSGTAEGGAGTGSSAAGSWTGGEGAGDGSAINPAASINARTPVSISLGPTRDRLSIPGPGGQTRAGSPGTGGDGSHCRAGGSSDPGGRGVP